ncbi:diiron oxygenase [Streptomyces sp. NBC_01478]|uniref:diiron oxygenase n=1 Tax=Streptomyces sp. NBC_01478 TaxID=2903882 RepID=UPI002E37ACC9|nr:diiron oxygenase [Streptomyces sp. NBC_01478]
MTPSDTPRPHPPGPLDRWYEQAGVRTGVRRMFHEETERGKVFFPVALVPYAGHDAVRELPPERLRELTVRHLYQFLLSTTHLETRVVNTAAEAVANGRTGLDLPAALRPDAFKVYCDEGYHALYSLDLADQIAAVTGIAIPDQDYGGFVDRLRGSAHRALPGAPALAGLLQAVVFETLITAVLNEVPGDESVVRVVRDLLRDHARDEGRHHRFFSALFREAWTHLSAADRAAAAHALPELIRTALTWDLAPVRGSLRLAGLDPDTARRVAADCCAAGPDPRRLNETARSTLRLCAAVGVFELPGAREHFAAHGLGDGHGSGDDGHEETP